MAEEFLLTLHRIAVSPLSLLFIRKGDAAVFAEDYRLPLVRKAVCHRRLMTAVVKLRAQDLLFVRQIAVQKSLSVLLIIMQGDDVGDRMLPSVIGNHGAHRVKGLG